MNLEAKRQVKLMCRRFAKFLNEPGSICKLKQQEKSICSRFVKFPNESGSDSNPLQYYLTANVSRTAEDRIRGANVSGHQMAKALDGAAQFFHDTPDSRWTLEYLIGHPKFLTPWTAEVLQFSNFKSGFNSTRRRKKKPLSRNYLKEENSATQTMKWSYYVWRIKLCMMFS